MFGLQYWQPLSKIPEIYYRNLSYPKNTTLDSNFHTQYQEFKFIECLELNISKFIETITLKNLKIAI